MGNKKAYAGCPSKIYTILHPMHWKDSASTWCSMLSSWFTRRIPPANNMHFWCFHHFRQCTGKMILAHVIQTPKCIVLQAEVPIAPARNLYSHKNAARVAHECKQPYSSLHHCTASIFNPKYTTSVFLSCPMHYKCFFSLPHTICT